jgi:hypothetical protein
MMRRLLMTPLILLLFAAPAACGADTLADGVDDIVVGGDAGTTVPECPLTAEQASALTGRTLTDSGGCSFGDGIALLTITTASESAALMTYDYQRRTATETYRTVVDVERDGTGFVAVKDIEAQLVLIRRDGAYTVVMSSFGLDAEQYQRTLYRIVDAILA